MTGSLRLLSVVMFVLFIGDGCTKNEDTLSPEVTLRGIWQLNSVTISPEIPKSLFPAKDGVTDLLAELKQIYNTVYPNTYTLQFNANKNFATTVTIPPTYQCTSSNNGCNLIALIGLPLYKPDSSTWALNGNELSLATVLWTGGKQGSGELFSNIYSYSMSVDKSFLHLQHKGDFFWINQRLQDRTLNITLKRL